MGTLQDVLTGARNSAITWLSWLISIRSRSFSIRYFMNPYLEGYQKCSKSNLKNQFLLSKFESFNFDPLYFWHPLRYRVIKYLIEVLTYCKFDWSEQIYNSNLNICQDFSKSANLLDKQTSVYPQTVGTVPTNPDSKIVPPITPKLMMSLSDLLLLMLLC